jgi:hypothetical protein
VTKSVAETVQGWKKQLEAARKYRFTVTWKFIPETLGVIDFGYFANLGVAFAGGTIERYVEGTLVESTPASFIGAGITVEVQIPIEKIRALGVLRKLANPWVDNANRVRETADSLKKAFPAKDTKPHAILDVRTHDLKELAGSGKMVPIVVNLVAAAWNYFALHA